MKPATSRPVLLGGQNRSGTTVLSVLLDSHPQLTVGPEIDFLEPVNLGSHILEAIDLLAANDARVLGPGTDTADPTWYDGAHFVKQCHRSGISFDSLRDIIRAVRRECGTDPTDFADRCRVIDAIGEHRRAETGALRWGLKLQRKINRVDEFAEFWPGAQFVHIVRDGRDLATSHLKTVSWGFRTIEEAAHGWLDVVGAAHRRAPAGRYLEVRYEDLVEAPERALREIVAFLDLPWHDAVLSHWQVPHTLFENPWGHPAAAAAARPLSRDRVGRYRSELSSDQVAEFERIAGEELARMGYAVSQYQPT